MIDELERSKLFDVVRMGCPREAGAKLLGLTLAQLEEEAARDPEFGKRLLQSEGEAVLLYMRTVRNASNDEKNWRTSAWWLDRQERLARTAQQGGPGFSEAVVEALERFAAVIVEEISDVVKRQWLLQRLINIAAEGAGQAGESNVIDVEPARLECHGASEAASAPAEESREGESHD